MTTLKSLDAWNKLGYQVREGEKARTSIRGESGFSETQIIKRTQKHYYKPTKGGRYRQSHESPLSPSYEGGGLYDDITLDDLGYDY